MEETNHEVPFDKDTLLTILIDSYLDMSKMDEKLITESIVKSDTENQVRIASGRVVIKPSPDDAQKSLVFYSVNLLAAPDNAALDSVWLFDNFNVIVVEPHVVMSTGGKPTVLQGADAYAKLSDIKLMVAIERVRKAQKIQTKRASQGLVPNQPSGLVGADGNAISSGDSGKSPIITA